MRKNKVLGALIFILIALVPIVLVSLTSVSAVIPFGANLTFINSTKAPDDYPGNNSAIAGNITEMNIYGFTRTQTWQGYMGNVSGTIFLADYWDNQMYNWSLASPSGEVYASRNDTLNWYLVQCFNFTANGSSSVNDDLQNGSTNLYGMNLTQLEAAYGINYTQHDIDGVNETFSLTGTQEWGGGFAHNLFYTNNLQFSAGECLSTTLFSSVGVVQGQFQEVLLYEPQARQPVFVSILDEENPAGFDDRPHDFEMLVLEDGHGTDRATTAYYFYVELE